MFGNFLASVEDGAVIFSAEGIAHFFEGEVGREVFAEEHGDLAGIGDLAHAAERNFDSEDELMRYIEAKKDMLENYGINLENLGVIPDVWVENTPEDVLNGFDRELKAAVDEALRMLSSGAW